MTGGGDAMEEEGERDEKREVEETDKFVFFIQIYSYTLNHKVGYLLN